MKNKIAKELVKLINIPSYGKIEEEHKIIQHLTKSFSSCKEVVVIKGEDGSSHLLIGINTNLQNLKDCILLSGHIDTVVPSSNHQPKAQISGNKIVGLGCADMKSFTAILISNIEKLQQSKLPIVFALTTDEEKDFFGIGSLINEIKKTNINPSLVIVGEPTNSKFSFSNQGNSIFVSKMHGRPCHTSTPELGLNAIYLSAKMAEEVEKIAHKYKNEATISATKIQGGTAPNIVPEFCSLNFSVRTYSNSILKKITEEIEKAQKQIAKDAPKSTLTNMFTIPPFEARENSFFSSFATKHQIEIVESKFSSEAGDIQLAFPDSEIVLFGAGDPSKIHKAGEEISIGDLLSYSNILLEIINDYSLKKEKNIDKINRF